MSSRETVLSREDLYAQVWSTPMRRLAEQYGISDVGLAKICKRHQIPRPPVGYWAKKEFGKTVEQPPLPATADADLLKVYIRESPPTPACEEEVEARPVVKDPELLRLIQQETDPKNRIVVSSSLRSPHPVVAETKQCLHDATPDQYGKIRPRHLDRLSHLDVRITKSSVGRVLLILDALAKALERRGHKFELYGDGWQRATYIKVFGERLSIQLTEKSRQIEHKLTEEEKRREDRVGFLYSRPKYDYIGTGVLELHLMGDHGYALNTWRDGKSKIEDCLNDFVIAAYVAVERQRENRRRQEQVEIERRQEEHRRWEEEQRRREEAARRKELEEMAASWAKARQIREFLAAVRESHQEVIEEGSAMFAWLCWAEKQANSFDPLVPSDRITKNLARGTDRQEGDARWTLPNKPR